MKDLPKIYNAKEVEGKIYNLWEEKGLFSAKVSQKKEPYAIVIPPPNVTGILHIGHALNNTLQDIIVRYKRMQGMNVWDRAGYDMHGLPTANLVQKNLKLKDKKAISFETRP